jgi:hypothetical protein
MKYFKITTREINFFFLGVLTMFLIVLIYDWQDFKAGWNGASIQTKTEVKR